MYKNLCATFCGKPVESVESVEKLAATALKKQSKRKDNLRNDRIRGD